MSTKKGTIVNLNDKWVIADKITGLDKLLGVTEIHPDSLPTILSNGSLKPEYLGEVEYEIKTFNEYTGTSMLTGNSFPVQRDYAIPKPVESKGDVWEEAWKEYRNSGGGLNDHLFLNYLKQHYQLTKTNP